MEQRGPAALYKKLTDFLTEDSHPVDIENLISNMIYRLGWNKTRPEADETAERWKKAFLKKLRTELSKHRENGQHIVFDFNSSNPSLIQGCCFVEPGDSPDTVALKQSLKPQRQYLSAIKGVKPDDFEKLCAGILGLLGVSKPQKSMAAGDDGIDFFGRLELESHLPIQALPHSVLSKFNVWLVGQAKQHRDTKISTVYFRELVGTLRLARHRIFGREAAYQDLSIRPCDPVFMLFITTGELSSRSWRVASLAGIIGMDGDQVAALLATSKIGLDSAGIFSPLLFQKWVQQH